MAHGLERNDDMAFVGELPWHSLGVKLDRLATAAEMLAAVESLRANVVKIPVQYKGENVPGKFFTVREDTDAVLGIVGQDYRILQNASAFNVIDAITMDSNGPKYETAGVLWGGRKVWALARFPELLTVRPGDKIAQYLLISNSHDGSSAVRIQETAVRVVCANTEAMARNEKGVKKLHVRHSGDIFAKVRDAQEVLGIVREDFLSSLQVYKDMAKVTPSDEQVTACLEKLFPDTKSDRASLQRERVRTLSESGFGNGGGSAWDLYNGVTQLVDHNANEGSKRPDALDMRLNSMWFGSGMAFKQEALDTVLETCCK